MMRIAKQFLMRFYGPLALLSSLYIAILCLG